MYIIVNSRNAILLCIIFVSFISTLLSSQETDKFINNNNNNYNIDNLQRSTKSFLSRIPIPVTAFKLFDSFKSYVNFKINNGNNNFLTSSEEFAATGSGVLEQFITVDPVVATIQQLPSSHHITPTNEATTDSPTLLYDVIGKSDIQHMMLDHHQRHQISVKQFSSKRASLFDFSSKLGEIS